MIPVLRLALPLELPDLPELGRRAGRLAVCSLALVLWTLLLAVLVRQASIRVFWGFDPWDGAHWTQAWDAFMAGWVLDTWHEIAFLLSPVATLAAWMLSLRPAWRAAGRLAVRLGRRPPAAGRVRPLGDLYRRREAPSEPAVQGAPAGARGTGAAGAPAPEATGDAAPPGAAPAAETSTPEATGGAPPRGPALPDETPAPAVTPPAAPPAVTVALPAAAAAVTEEPPEEAIPIRREPLASVSAWAQGAGWAVIPGTTWPAPDDLVDPADCSCDAVLADAGTLWLVRIFEEADRWIPRDGDPAYESDPVWELAGADDEPSGIEVPSPAAALAAARDAFRRLWGSRLRDTDLVLKAVLVLSTAELRPDPEDDPAVEFAAAAWLDLDIAVATLGAGGGDINGVDMLPGPAGEPADAAMLEHLLGTPPEPEAESW